MATATAQMQPVFFTPQELGDILKISERTVRLAIEAGEIRATRLGKRVIRVPQHEVDRLLRSEPVRRDPDCAEPNGRQKTPENNGTSAI
jgi:excisionase family DNA binding protein